MCAILPRACMFLWLAIKDLLALACKKGVMNFYLLQAYQHLGEADVPKFTVIVTQKIHHTDIFQANGHENVPPGICYPKLL